MTTVGPMTWPLMYWLNDRNFDGVAPLATFGPFSGVALVVARTSETGEVYIAQYNSWGSVPTLQVALPPDP